MNKEEFLLQSKSRYLIILQTNCSYSKTVMVGVFLFISNNLLSNSLFQVKCDFSAFIRCIHSTISQNVLECYVVCCLGLFMFWLRICR